MRAIVQRVTEARVRVGDRVTGEIARGLVVLIGIAKADGPEDVRSVAGKRSRQTQRFAAVPECEQIVSDLVA